jgi:beta-phosphoglucomutase
MQDIGVVFDMDGVLVDSAADHLRSWQALGRELGREVTAEQFARTFGQRSSEIIAQLFGITDAAGALRLDERKEALYRDLIRGRVPIMPGALRLIQSLHGAGFYLAVGSSGPPENINLVCTEMGLNRFLSTIVTGRDVRRGKPDPQVFELAAKRLRLDPSRCLVVEDAPSGIEAAHRAGMKCIALAGSHRPDALRAADRVVRRLVEIECEMVRELIEG